MYARKQPQVNPLAQAQLNSLFGDLPSLEEKVEDPFEGIHPDDNWDTIHFVRPFQNEKALNLFGIVSEEHGDVLKAFCQQIGPLFEFVVRKSKTKEGYWAIARFYSSRHRHKALALLQKRDLGDGNPISAQKYSSDKVNTSPILLHIHAANQLATRYFNSVGYSTKIEWTRSQVHVVNPNSGQGFWVAKCFLPEGLDPSVPVSDCIKLPTGEIMAKHECCVTLSLPKYGISTTASACVTSTGKSKTEVFGNAIKSATTHAYRLCFSRLMLRISPDERKVHVSFLDKAPYNAEAEVESAIDPLADEDADAVPPAVTPPLGPDTPPMGPASPEQVSPVKLEKSPEDDWLLSSDAESSSSLIT